MSGKLTAAEIILYSNCGNSMDLSSAVSFQLNIWMFSSLYKNYVIWNSTYINENIISEWYNRPLLQRNL